MCRIRPATIVVGVHFDHAVQAASIVSNTMLAVLTTVIATTAVGVAVWQIHANARGIDRSNSLPAMSEAFNEFRSVEFQGHLRKVWREAPTDVPAGGFQDLPEEWRASAYTVAYFFEYLGLLVAYDLVPEDSVVDFSANMIGRSWRALEPFIQAERAYRSKVAPPGVSNGFVSHFEHLAVLTLSTNGHSVDSEIHRRIKLRSFRSTGTM